MQAALVYLQIVLLSKSQNAGNMKQDSYQRPFYCNFDFTCLVSTHVQTLNECPDTKKWIWMFSSWIIIRIVRYLFQICIYIYMKPTFKASNSTINVLRAPGFDSCTVWFVGSLSCSRGMTQPTHTHTHTHIYIYM